MQNEFIQMLADHVEKGIIQQVKDARYYAVILDCTQDFSRVEQMSLVVRFVGSKGEAEEHFLDFMPVHETTGESLAGTLLQKVEDLGLSLSNCRGQGYDNSSNIQGKNCGVQARLLQQNPRAFFVPCGCHSWNLVLGDAAAASNKAVLFFGTLQRIYTLLSASPRRWKLLTDAVGFVGLTVKALSETRWECWIESVKAIRWQLPDIVDVLQQVSTTPGDPMAQSDASSLCTFLQSFEFILSTVVWHDILFKVNIMSKTWQTHGIEMDVAVQHIDGFLEWIQDYREHGFAAADTTAKEIATSMDVPCEYTPVKIRRKRRLFDYEGEDSATHTPRELFKTDYFLRVIDSISQSVKERFDLLKAFFRGFDSH
ncbi:zinc finger MYM-type protein 1-like [Penaeus monodon]|uniref:zinc finger MYM-type protein 1-like n=1 Tax=Penaeus monodon TaxID=6687 RepID=UPI0018A731A5|nr:zinc finger MYM-type protein 1-like [Penaeus monodon]